MKPSNAFERKRVNENFHFIYQPLTRDIEAVAIYIILGRSSVMNCRYISLPNTTAPDVILETFNHITFGSLKFGVAPFFPQFGVFVLFVVESLE